MPEIRPFKAFVYNQDKIKDLWRVVCPPYDVISPEKQIFYHGLDEHNFLHILLSKAAIGQDKYKTAGDYFRSWIKEQILINDEKPAIYFYNQEYALKGEKKSRLGFIALLRLDEKKSNVFGHEHTRLEPKEDRLKLIREVKANLSPIFAIFPDKKRIINRIYQQDIGHEKPFIDITDTEKVTHKLWRIDSKDAISYIQQSLASENIFIADGHHRYEVACVYRDEMKEALGQTTGEEDFNYIMAYFTNADNRGLTIFPIHRLVKLNTQFSTKEFRLNLQDYFDLEEVKDKNEFFFLMQKAGNNEHVIGLYEKKKFLLLRLKNIKILDRMIADKPKEYRLLDVSVLNYIILKKILGLDIEDKEKILFNHEAEEIIKQVDNSDNSIGLFLNPVKMQQIISVALQGEKMPSKSTYFYPKVLSGLVINKLEE